MKKIGLLLCLIIPMCVFSQDGDDGKGKMLNLGMEYGFQFSGGDLKDRFGTSGALGGKLELLFKNNISVSVNGSFIFGRNVKEDPIRNLRNQDSLFIGNNFSLANIFLRQRGFYIGGSVGKLFSIPKNNNRSGIKVELGVGLFQHKIRIQDDPESFVPALSGAYKKGYDRLTNGLALQQFIGYQHHSKNKLINFYAGVEFNEGFTQNRRTVNYDTGLPDETKRLDITTTLKFGWILPFFVGDTGEEVFY